MSKEAPRILVAGSGQSGLDWVRSKQAPDHPILDLQPILNPRITWERGGESIKGKPLYLASDIDFSENNGYDPQYIMADTLFLDRRFKPESFDLIHADVLLNGISIHGFKPPEMMTRYKEASRSPYCPVEVADFFDKFLEFTKTNSVFQTFSQQDQEDRKGYIFRHLLQNHALEQMWKVLSPGGELQVVDMYDLYFLPQLSSKSKFAECIGVAEDQIDFVITDPTEDDRVRSEHITIKKNKGYDLKKYIIRKK